MYVATAGSTLGDEESVPTPRIYEFAQNVPGVVMEGTASESVLNETAPLTCIWAGVTVVIGMGTRCEFSATCCAVTVTSESIGVGASELGCGPAASAVCGESAAVARAAASASSTAPDTAPSSRTPLDGLFALSIEFSFTRAPIMNSR